MAENRLIRTWYVLHTKSRFENVVNDLLLKKSMEVYLPKIKVKSNTPMALPMPKRPEYIA